MFSIKYGGNSNGDGLNSGPERNIAGGAKEKRSRRNQKGAALALIVVAALLLCYLIYLGFQYCMLNGGSREVRNGVDASVLNISKRIFDVKVPPTGAYADCADSTGMIGLSNINRVWGKAYLISANIDEMKQDGVVTNDAVGAGEAAYQMAEDVSKSLHDVLSDRTVLNGLFSNMASQRRVPMLGGAAIQHSSDFQTYPVAMVDRGAESNISFDASALPKNATVNQVNAGNGNYIQGYSPFKANSKTFCFVPFRLGETPHLIADSYFNSNRADSHPITDCDFAIPNAFQGHGGAGGGTIALGATASAVANPQLQFQLTVPHAFLRIKFSNHSVWMIDGKPRNTMPYGSTPEKYWGIRDRKLKDGRTINGWATLGTEYSKPSLLAVIDAVPGDHTPGMQKLLQRAKEIEPAFTMDRLRALLSKQEPDPKNLTYFIFPKYSTEDLTDPQLDIASSGKGLPDWLAAAAGAEAEQREIVKEQVLTDNENATVLITGNPPDCPKWMEISGAMKWRPGTGMGQCLGTLYLDRVTTVFYKPGTED
ncbi:MAG: hypothetical protein K2X93_29470 [Candidatus Obscuribacterales bacterium]|nr:hypothetical protein [Candidatus Obscuribacterales bacterium]